MVFVNKIVLKLILNKNNILLSQFYYKVSTSYVLFPFNQFVKLLFYILHFCILGQTERMATSFSCCGNNEKDDV